MIDQNLIQVLMQIESKLDAVLARLPQAKAAAQPVSGARPTQDEEVKKDPRSWQGPSCVGLKYSQCQPDFLDQLAGLLEWMAKKDDEAGARGETNARGYPKSGKFKSQDAHLARSWAAYLRSPEAAVPSPLGDLPF